MLAGSRLMVRPHWKLSISSMKCIQLTKGCVAIVDDEDFDAIAQWRWNCNPAGYAVRSAPRSNGRQGKIYMHRVIAGAKKGEHVDHKNRIKSDNRRENLRIATRSQNGYNITKTSRNTSGFKGVSWHKGAVRFIASIGHDGVLRHLGYFDTAEDAALAYNAAAIRLHGEFANLN